MYQTPALEQLVNLGIYVYQSHETLDYVMLQWLENMRRSGDLSHTLSSSVRTPAQFLSFINQRVVLYSVDSFANLTHACWFEPCMGSTFMSYYVRPEDRLDHKQKLFFVYDCINAAFEAGDVNTICGFIQHRETDELTRKFIRLHERLGYTYSGRVERFFDGRDCHIVAITREAWEGNDGGFKRAWRRERDNRGDGRREGPVAGAQFAGVNHVQPNGAAAASGGDTGGLS